MKKKNRIITNTVVGAISQIIILLLGLIVPRIILINYGSDANGLISTITQIFMHMALLEAGISASSKNVLYGPINSGNKKDISYWLSVSRNYYRRISAIYLFAVIVLSIVLPYTFKTEIDFWTIFFYILFEGLTNIVAFYFVNTWTCFLVASGKTYITNTISLINKILCYAVKIILALYGLNIALIQVGYFIVSLIQLVIYYVYMKNKYEWIDYHSAPKSARLPDKNAYVITEITWTVFSSTDMIVLSVFLSTSMASVYYVYSMVFASLNGLLNAVYNALNYNLGQTYNKSIDLYKKLHDLFNSVFLGSITALMCTAYILIFPFIKLYTKGVSDINYFYKWLPLLFCLIQLLSWSRYLGGNLIGVAGRLRPAVKINIIEAALNLIGSIALVNIFGITGVVLATVVALPLKVVYCNYIADIKVLKRSCSKTILIIMINFILFFITVLVNSFLQITIQNYLSFVLWGGILLCLFSVISFVLNGLVNKDLFGLFKHLRRR